MIGAVCGDILGSTYEFGIGNEEVYLHHEEDHFTDDSVLTFALAGVIAFAYYKKIPEEILTHCLDCLDERLLNILQV